MNEFKILNGYVVKDETTRNNIGTLSNLNTTEKSNLVGAINEVNLNIGSLTDLETTSQTNVVSAINEIDTNTNNLENYFNIDTFITISDTDMSLSNQTATIESGSQLTLATNSDYTLFKLYGKIDVNVNQITGTLNLTFSTPLRPSTAININNGYIAVLYKTGGTIYSIQAFAVNIATDGTITMPIATGSTTILQSCILQPCLYFLKDFGD